MKIFSRGNLQSRRTLSRRGGRLIWTRAVILPRLPQSVFLCNLFSKPDTKLMIAGWGVPFFIIPV